MDHGSDCRGGNYGRRRDRCCRCNRVVAAAATVVAAVDVDIAVYIDVDVTVHVHVAIRIYVHVAICRAVVCHCEYIRPWSAIRWSVGMLMRPPKGAHAAREDVPES